MVRYVLASVAVLAAVVVAVGVDVGSGPQPAPTAVSWAFEFKYDHPKRIAVQLPGESQPTVFWYMVYTVTNPGPRTQDFFPLFQLVTEDLRVIDTDMGINPLVFDAIKERHKQTHQYLVRPREAIGPLLAGDDHARESVAIWRSGELDVHSFKIFIAGLSGETQFAPNPRFDPNSPETVTQTGPDGKPQEVPVNPRRFTLRKTLELRYELPGSERARATVEPVFVTERWIMR